jgi:tetratricopeptide (TPR) repeat protein
MNVNQGTLSAVEHDKRGHISAMRHSARTTAGNSGGPLYDLELGGVIGAHNISVMSRRHPNDPPETLTFRAVPADWIVREFPQIAAALPQPKLHGEERDALIAFYFMQERFGAALDHPASEFLGAILGARTAVEIDDYKTGLDLASRAVRLQASNPDAHVILGHVYAGMGQWDKARTEYKEALSLSGNLNAEAHAALGCIAIAEWMMQNEINTIPPKVAPQAQLVAEAKASLNRSLELWPARNFASHCCLALIAGLEGKQDEISPRLVRCLAAGHNDPDAKLGVATVLLMMGNFDQASGQVDEAMAIRESAHAVFLDGWVALSTAAEAAKQGKNDVAGKLAQVGGMKYLIASQMSPNAAWAPTAIKVGRIFYKPQ